jgi:hypothetical protein
MITLDPISDPVAEIQKIPNKAVEAKKRVLRNLTVRAKIPDPRKVKAVYRIPPIGYAMGRIAQCPRRFHLRCWENKFR